MPKLTNHLDFGQKEAQNAVAHILASDPSSPTKGQFWFNDTSKVFRYYNGTSVVTLTSLDTEAVQDIFGAMVSGNTESGITVTYDDTTGVINLSVTDAPTVAGNSPAQLRDRATHTGTQTASTISDFATAVDARVQLVIDAAPAALDTLNELAAALGDDPNFAATITTQLGALDTRLDAIEANGGPVKKFTQLIGNGSATIIAVTHNLGTKAITAQVWEAATDELVIADVVATSTTVATIKCAVAPALNSYRVVITG